MWNFVLIFIWSSDVNILRRTATRKSYIFTKNHIYPFDESTVSCTVGFMKRVCLVYTLYTYVSSHNLTGWLTVIMLLKSSQLQWISFGALISGFRVYFFI